MMILLDDKIYWILLYILTSIWVLGTPKAIQNSHFQHFFVIQSKKKQKICSKILQKTNFLSLHQNADRHDHRHQHGIFFKPKYLFYYENGCFTEWLGELFPTFAT